MKRPLPVAAAWLRDEDGNVLLCRRHTHKARGGLWEFPGGKLEGNETPEEAVLRELEEELGLTARAGKELARTVHAYPEITIELILIDLFDPRGELTLTDHSEIHWCGRDEIGELKLAQADRKLLSKVRRQTAEKH